MRAVILAGGKGTRLAPYTTILPKPLMPIDGMPILEIVIRQLKRSGFSDITIAGGYLGHLLKAYLEDGRRWGVRIRYCFEEKPLGTAGPLTLIDDLSNTFLVMNGDVLTTLDYADLLQYHQRKKTLATVAMCDRDVEVSLGVLEVNGKNEITDYIEKPSLKYHASMGIYVFEPRILKYLRSGEAFDLPDLIKAVLKDGEQATAYHFKGRWRDLGRREDYEKATEEFVAMKGEFLG